MSEVVDRERIDAQGGELLDAVRRLVREGNVRRVVIRHDQRVIAQFPLTIGVVGAALAPTLAAIGAIAALLADCTLEVERRPGAGQEAGEPMTAQRD